MILPKRTVIYPKDIQLITGKKEKTARKLLNKVKISLGKGKDEFVIVKEFCDFYGIPEEEANKFIL